MHTPQITRLHQVARRRSPQERFCSRRGGTTLSIVAINLVLFFVPGVSPAQSPSERFPSCEPATKSIQVRVKSKTIPATGGAAERRVWILVEVPGADQIQLPEADSALKSQISASLQELTESGAEIGVGKSGDPQPGDPFQIETQLRALRDDLDVVFPSGLSSPPATTDDGQTYTTRICLTYQSVKIRPVEIRISTLSGASGGTRQDVKLADISERFRGAGHPEGSIVVTIAYAQPDVEDARKDTTQPDAEAAVKRELFQVAVAAFDTAVEKSLLGQDGVPKVDADSTGGEIAAAVQSEITSLYNLNAKDPKINWGNVRARVQVRDLTPASPWIIDISGLQFAQAVDIQVNKSPAELEFDGTPTEEKFEARRNKVRDKLRAEHLSQLHARPGHIITAKDIDDDQEILRSDKKTVKSVGELTSGAASPAGTPQPQVLIYTVSRHLKAEKILSLKLGGGYSPEEHISGNAAIEDVNMLGLAETAKLDYTGGPQVQKIRFNFDRPFASDGTAGFHVTKFGMKVQYFADKDLRLANLTAQEIADRETGSEIRLSFKYDSFSAVDHSISDCLEKPDRKRAQFYFGMTPVFGYRDVKIKDDNPLLTITHIDRSLLPRARTQTTTLAVDGNIGFAYDFRQSEHSGMGKLNISLNGRLQRGLRLFGADYKYNKYSATFSTDLLFGFISWRDFLVRYNHLLGSGTHGTPVFELFRLGGPQNVRGLEEGEFIGRKINADQIELGLNAQIIRHLITRKPVASLLQKSDCPDSEAGGPKPPIDLNNTYLKVFFDRGRVRDPDSFVIAGGINRLARGYGVALELRALGGQNINLSIGYARSRESVLHKSGTIFTGVSYSF